jgi:hypothetical protein
MKHLFIFICLLFFTSCDMQQGAHRSYIISSYEDSEDPPNNEEQQNINEISE